MSQVRIPAAELERWSADLLEAAGVPPGHAAEVAGHLIFAELRGISSHGLCRLPLYLERIRSGAIAPDARPQILRESPVSALVDGANGPGQVIARHAADLVAQKAGQAGLAAVAVRNSNHCGCLAYYTLRLAEKGLIGLATTNAMATMPPFGGSEPFFGTNPISLAAPADDQPPFVLDMAVSEAARGKILNAARSGRSIPVGWALDQHGAPTTDPVAALAGLILPMAGPKGSALALLVEILSGLLSGGPVGPEITTDPISPQEIGHFFLAIRPDLFVTATEFGQRMAEVMARMQAIRPAPGHERVLVPGELERLRAAENSRLGIPLEPALLAELEATARAYGRSGPLRPVAGMGPST